MSFAIAVPARLSEWGWLFGFALVSLALVGLAVLADAVYEGYGNGLAEATARRQRQPGMGESRGSPGRRTMPACREKRRPEHAPDANKEGGMPYVPISKPIQCGSDPRPNRGRLIWRA